MRTALSQEFEFLTIREAAEVLRCTERTVRQKVSDGCLRGYRNGKRILISKQDLQQYINSRVVRLEKI
jgi:excisionase family DNA binding protein